jgi:hypothetical protein
MHAIVELNENLAVTRRPANIWENYADAQNAVEGFSPASRIRCHSAKPQL